MTFATDLAAARATVIHRPEDAVIAVVAARYGLTTDPLDERGVQGPWYRAREAVDLALRVMVQGLDMTWRTSTERMGYSPTRAYNCRRPPILDADELDVLDEALELVGRSR